MTARDRGSIEKARWGVEMFWMLGGSIFIRLSGGSVVGHGLQDLRSRIDLGRARTLRKWIAFNVAFLF